MLLPELSNLLRWFITYGYIILGLTRKSKFFWNDLKLTSDGYIAGLGNTFENKTRLHWKHFSHLQQVACACSSRRKNKRLQEIWSSKQVEPRAKRKKLRHIFKCYLHGRMRGNRDKGSCKIGVDIHSFIWEWDKNELFRVLKFYREYYARKLGNDYTCLFSVGNISCIGWWWLV